MVIFGGNFSASDGAEAVDIHLHRQLLPLGLKKLVIKLVYKLSSEEMGLI